MPLTDLLTVTLPGKSGSSGAEKRTLASTGAEDGPSGVGSNIPKVSTGSLMMEPGAGWGCPNSLSAPVDTNETKHRQTHSRRLHEATHRCVSLVHGRHNATPEGMATRNGDFGRRRSAVAIAQFELVDGTQCEVRRLHRVFLHRKGKRLPLRPQIHVET